MLTVEQRVASIIVERLGIFENQMSLTTPFKNNSHLNVHDMFNIIKNLEFEFDFDCEIPAEDLETFITIGDVIQYVKRRTGQ